MAEDLAARIRAEIERGGPIGFDAFMRLALYGPGGFFERPPVGARAHFVTAPHVHPFVFAHCVRDALLDAWSALDEPDPFPVVELGAGDGTLAEALAATFDELPRPRLAYTAVEISTGAREALDARGFRAVSELEALEPFEGVAFANELLDNLPFVPVRGTADGAMEIRVGLDGASFVEVEVPWSRADVAPPSLAPGAITTVPIGAFAILEALAAKLSRGYAVLVDHGTVDGPAGPPRAYVDQRRTDDVLADPGSRDITAGVDLRVVTERARALGCSAFEPVPQSDALSALGRDRWDDTMRRVQTDLLEAGRGAEAVRVWEARSRASLLAEPSGLGAFWWLVLATDRLPEPAWLARARERG